MIANSSGIRIAVWTAVASGLAATCLVLLGRGSTASHPEPTVSNEPIYLHLEDFDLVNTEVLIGQERMDARRAQAQQDLEKMLAVDPDHPGVEQIRKALADLDREERQLHWRISRGFTRPDGVWNTDYTQEEYLRAMIEDRELLGLTDERVREIEAFIGVAPP